MVGQTKSIFAVVGGSRSLGISRATSDTDLLIIHGNVRRIDNIDGYNVIYWPAEQFVSTLTGVDNGYSHIYQFLYPETFLSAGEVTSWIKLHRDELLTENRDVFYRTLRAHFLNIESKLDVYYRIAVKRVVYMLCYGQVLCSYANGLSLSSCFQARGEWRDTLLRVMSQKMSFEELVALTSKLHKDIERSELKFEPVESKPITTKMQNLFLDSEFMSYEEMRDAGYIQPLT